MTIGDAIIHVFDGLVTMVVIVAMLFFLFGK